MAPEAQECVNDRLPGGDQSEEDPDDVVVPVISPKSGCCPCCRRWQRRRKRSRRPKGTDKVGPTDNQTLLSGGETRFYCCCHSKMLTRPTSGPSRVNPTNSSSHTVPAIEEGVPVSSGLCSFFRFRESKCPINQRVQTEVLVDVAFDAFDERAYLDEFEIIHHEDYNIDKTVRNPDVPYYDTLEHPELVGRVIIIDGTVPLTAQRFSINFVCRGRNDIAMHFNPRLDRGYIARNTKINGKWGDEENAMTGPSPFSPGEDFTLHILVAEDSFKFCHNGRHICSYPHRMPLARIQTMDIHGDVSLTRVKHELMREYPPPCDPVYLEMLLQEPRLLSKGHTALVLPVAGNWTTEIPKQSFFFLGRFEPQLNFGYEVTIGGNVRLLPHGFFVNFQNGGRLWKPPDVHLHINPRFRRNEGHNELILNARLKGEWGFEKRHFRCRFQPGMKFRLSMYVDEERYLLLVNGAPLAWMDHRARPSEVDSLYVCGDVDITSVGCRQVEDPKELLDKFPKEVHHSAKSGFVDSPRKRSESLRSEAQSLDSVTRYPEQEASEEDVSAMPGTSKQVWHDKFLSKVPIVAHAATAADVGVPGALEQGRPSTHPEGKSLKTQVEGNGFSTRVPGEATTPKDRKKSPPTDANRLKGVPAGKEDVVRNKSATHGPRGQQKPAPSKRAEPPIEHPPTTGSNRKTKPVDVAGVAPALLGKDRKKSVTIDEHRPTEFPEKRELLRDVTEESVEATAAKVNLSLPTGSSEKTSTGATSQLLAKEGEKPAKLLRKSATSKDKGLAVADEPEQTPELVSEKGASRALRRSSKRTEEEVLGTFVTVPTTVSEEKLVSSLKFDFAEKDRLISDDANTVSEPIFISVSGDRSFSSDAGASRDPPLEDEKPAVSSHTQRLAKLPRAQRKTESSDPQGSTEQSPRVAEFDDDPRLTDHVGVTSPTGTTTDKGIESSTKSDDSVLVTAEPSPVGSTVSNKVSDEATTMTDSLVSNKVHNAKTDEVKNKSKR